VAATRSVFDHRSRRLCGTPRDFLALLDAPRAILLMGDEAKQTPSNCWTQLSTAWAR
jgi:hypothetical protein